MSTSTHRYTGDGEQRSRDLEEIVDELTLGWTTTAVVERPEPKRGVHPRSCAVPAVWRMHPRQHVVQHDALLAQLGPILSTTATAEQEGGGALPGPRAGARLGAIAVRARIDAEATTWLKAIGAPCPVSLAARLCTLVKVEAQAHGMKDERGRVLVKAAASWRAAARIVTGYDSKPWSPNVPCPNVDCEQRQTIRVRFDIRAALCVECGDTWEDDRLLQLGTYVAWATVHLAGVRHLVADEDEVGVALLPCRACAGERVTMAQRREARAAGLTRHELVAVA